MPVSPFLCFSSIACIKSPLRHILAFYPGSPEGQKNGSDYGLFQVLFLLCAPPEAMAHLFTSMM
jgi:hypothetical protein